MQTDASQDGIGAALIQNQEGNDRVIAYASRTLSGPEKNYSVTEKECLAIVWGIKKMRPYLEGYHFVVETDHQSLKWLQSLKNPTGRLARWVMDLQQYSFDIKYKKGVLNKLADTLSRSPVNICLIEEIQCTWYDKKLKEIEENPENSPDFKIIDGKLYKHFFDRNDFTEPELSNPWKLCLPENLRNNVLLENHDEPTAGHMGIAKTISRIAKRYYWPGMFRTISNYVRKCLVCQKYKSSQQQTAGMMSFSPTNGPWDTVSTDLIGPLPRSSKGNNYVIVFQDRFTKWTEVQPIRKATTAKVCEIFRHKILSHFGCPRVVISDNGTQFNSKKFSKFLSTLSIRHHKTSLYTPQANPVERRNKDIRTIISQYCEKDHRKWDQFIPEFIFAINSAVHDSTGFSPAFLNFGRELELPNGLYKSNEELTPNTEQDVRNRALNISKMEEVFELVNLNIERAFTKQSRYYNMKRRDFQYKVGDNVMKRDHHLSSGAKGFASKLASKFSGPFIISKVISPNIYNLKNQSNKEICNVRIKDLKKAHIPSFRFEVLWFG